MLVCTVRVIYFIWQVDRVSDPAKTKLEAEKRPDVVCISALNGEGLQDFCMAVQEKLKVLCLFNVFIFLVVFLKIYSACFYVFTLLELIFYLHLRHCDWNLKGETSLLQDSMVWVEALIPFEKGDLLSTIHQVGMVERTVSILHFLITFILFFFLLW